MIARDYAVKLAARCAQKDRIGRERAAHVDVVFRAAGFHCGTDLRCFFDSKQSAFGAVRIERRHRETWPVDSPAPELSIGEPNSFLKTLALNQSNSFGQGNVS